MTALSDYERGAEMSRRAFRNADRLAATETDLARWLMMRLLARMARKLAEAR